MDKMNGKIYKYTLILFIVAVLFIIIGGISIGRVSEYEQNNQQNAEAVEMVELPKSEYEDLVNNANNRIDENQQIVDILHAELTDEEKIDEIEKVLFGETKAE